MEGRSAGEVAEPRRVELVTVKTRIKSLPRKFQRGRTKKIVKLINGRNTGCLF